MKSNHGRFQKGIVGKYRKVCANCDKVFIARSGSRKFCPKCYHPPCKQCGKKLVSPHRKFCNNSCAGKWKYENLPQTRTIKRLHEHENYGEKRAQAISLARRGVPRYDMRGANNHKWKGGRGRCVIGNSTPGEWRRQVLLRDNFTCQNCGYKGDALDELMHAHHIKPRKKFPELAFDLDNGMALCKSCHHSYEAALKEKETKEGKRSKPKPRIWTNDDRRDYSERFSGENNPFYGRKHSMATRAKISEAKRRHQKT